jgi:predicted P-loop ATPase
MSDSDTPKRSAAGLTPPKSPVVAATTKAIRPQRLARLEFPDPPLQYGGPPATDDNIRFLLAHYGITVRQNVIKKRTEIIAPGLTGTTDNYDNDALTFICSHAARHGIAIGPIPAIIDLIARDHPYNPVADWIKSKPWDNRTRLPDICETLVTAPDFPADLKAILVTKWLLSCVAAALLPEGFHARGVLTLQGRQGIGKSSWCRSLIPDRALREMALKLDHHMDGGNKDSILGAISHWIVEIGELDSSFRRDIARLKGFLTNDRDKVRRPYARTESEAGRRTVFLATVNQADFLVDSTGNSRWWTLPVVEINFDHEVDMQQVFAELAVRLEAGDQWWLTPEEERRLEAQNERHRSFSMIEERLNEIVDWDSTDPDAFVPLNTTNLLRLVGIEHPTNPQAKECAAILRSRLGEPKRVQGIVKWRVPLRPGDFEERHTGSNPTRLKKDKFD